MAEINIQRKETSMWPWVVGGLVLVLVILFLAGVFSDDETVYEDASAADTTTQTNEPAAMNTEVPDDVESYLTYVREHNTDAMGLDHEYSSAALQRLAAALGAIATRDYAGDAEVQRVRDSLQSKADRIQIDPEATNHADMLRDAAMSVADLMETMQKKGYPNLGTQVGEVRSAATAIKPGVLTLEQKQEVQTFFTRAGEALESMAMARRSA